MLFLGGGNDVDSKAHAPSEVVNGAGTTEVGSAVFICFISGVVSRWRRRAICSNAVLVEVALPGNKEGLVCNR